MPIAEAQQYGPYRLIEKIGSGGMGEVYRALDTRLEREVALKLVSDNYLGVETPVPPGTPHDTLGSGSPLAHERFLREARSAATLNHPHVCSIYDTGEQDGRPYLVMELLRGVTLKQYLANHGGKGLAADQVLRFSQQAASALAAAHRQGIIHRDIKPANLFVLEEEPGKPFIKMLDFGLAKKQAGPAVGSDQSTIEAANDLTGSGSTLGTAAYMSPEQARGEALDPRTDLFSLGSVIYEMATGKAPFTGGSTAEIFAALLTQTPPPVSTVNRKMPKQIDPVVAKLLAKDPAQRYASTDVLRMDLEALDAFASHAGVVRDGAANKWPWVMAGVLVLLLAGGLAWWKLRPAPTPAAAPPARATTVNAAQNSIILADFVNHTGDPVFDTTLNQALQIDLEQSPVIKIVSQEHLAQSVKFLGKPADTPTTPAVAREIGIREGIKAILIGTIANLGKEYVITLSAQNTVTGDEIVSEQAQAPDKEHVLDALSKAVTTMRGKLGEDLASIRKLDTPFSQATTTSLEAFRAFALGEKDHGRGQDIPKAEGHYLRAVELDPRFAMGYARLGVISWNSGQVAKAKDYSSKAYELSKNVSERERFYIAGHYNFMVSGNLRKGAETLQEAIQAYPNEIDYYVNLNLNYQFLGDYEQGLPYAQKAVEIDPQDAIAATNLLEAYMALGRTAEIRAELERQERLGLNSSTGTLARGMVAHFLLGDEQKVQAAIAETAGRPDEFVRNQLLNFIQQYAGRYRLAGTTARREFEQAGRAKAPDVQAGILLQNASGEGMSGMCEGNRAAVSEALSLDKSRQTRGTALLAAAICGDSRPAAQAQELSKRYPQDTLVNEIFVPLSKAFVALSAGRFQEAIDAADPVKPYDANCPASYVQGLAYLQLHDGAQAVNAFEAARRKRSGANDVIFAPYWAQVHLGLGRAYAMTGNKGEARKAYEEGFRIWKDADADLPMLIAAKKEYAAL